MIRVRECDRRDCGNNPHRKVNSRDYDSVMGFLCSECEDDRSDPMCGLCDRRRSEHAEPFPCDEDEQD